MCGITGCAWTDPDKRLSPQSLRKMTDLLAHRGPDEDGAYISEYYHQPPYAARPGVALGFRRLSIIDVAGSRQPLANEDGSIRLVFNGEIYNFRDLRRRLEGAGHTFATTGDGETIVHLYEDEELGFLEHLVGMFALVLWDAPRGRLVLARDRIGQKPLVYRLEANRLLFASELKSLLAAPDVPREIDPAALDEYLTYQYVPHPHTIFRGIKKLAPAHYAVFENGRFSIEPYWQPDLTAEEAPELVGHQGELVQRLTESVRLRLQSDVPLGAFLSGGVDSSIIASLAQELSSQQLRTFSIGFSIPEYDESPYARRVAEYLRTDHHEFRVTPDCIELLPKLAWHYDEPFADSSAIVTFILSRLTKEHVTVALSGDGGDELFAGYPRYQAVRMAALIDRLPRPLRAFMTTRFWQRLPASGRQKGRRRLLKRFLAALAMSPEQRYAEWIVIFSQVLRADLYTGDFIASLPDSDPLDFLMAAFGRSRSRDEVTSAALADVLTYLPCDLCHKVDIASMAHGLECRQPLLDHRVVEFAARLPIREKLRGRRGKYILRKAFESRLPAEVFRRPKMGFAVPLDHWFRGELRTLLQDVLRDARTAQRGYFQASTIGRLLDEHDRSKRNHAQRLWTLLMLELWHREWVDSQ